MNPAYSASIPLSSAFARPQVRRMLVSTTALHWALSALLAYGMLHEIAADRVAIWVGLLWAGLALQLAFVLGHAPLPQSRAAPAERLLASGALLIAGCWGGAALLFLDVPEPGLAQRSLFYVLGGVAAAGGLVYAVQPRLAAAYLLLLLAPTAAIHLLAGGPSHAVLSAATVGYGLVLLAVVRRLARAARGICKGVGQEPAACRKQLQRTAVLEYALDHIYDAAYVIDTSGQVLYANDAACRELGYPRDELQGLSVYAFDPHLTKSFAEQIKGRVRAHQRTSLETEHRRRSGELFPVEVTISESLPFEGRDTFMCLARNLTDQKAHARALAEREAELRQALEFSEGVVNAIPDLLFELDREGRYLNVWARSPELLAARKEELLGSTVHRMLPPDAAEVVEAALAEADAHGTSFGRSMHLQLPHREYWFELSVAKKPSAEGRFIVLSRDITDRMRSQQQLELLDRAINQSADALFLIGGGVRFHYVNDAACRSLGYTREELLTLTPCDIDPVVTRESLIERRRSRAPEHGAVTFESVHRTREGRMFPVEVSTALVTHNGELFSLALVRNIAERKQMEHDLAARETELRTLVENMLDVVVRYDRECRRIFVSPSYEKVAGLTIAAALGKRPAECWGHPTMRPEAYEARLRTVMESGEPEELMLDWWSPEGEYCCQLLSLVPESGPDGTIGSVLTVARDVSELKRAEMLLYAREEAFRSLAENSPDAIARYDRDHRRVYVNPAVLTQSGISADRLLGTTPTEFPGGEGAAQYLEKIRESFSFGVETSFEMKWRAPDGGARCTHIRIVPERDRGRNIVSVLAIGRDITEIDDYRRRIFSLAFYDPMTGLANRALFNERLRKTLEEAEWHHHVAGVMLIDLDRFKNINDSLGHAIGDELLREAGTRLLHAIRGYDTVARLGGDEFAVLLPEIRCADDAGTVANKILSAFAGPFLLEGHELFITASVGVALYPDDGRSGAELLKFADSAMYHAKARGRNNFQFYRAEMTARAEERLMLEGLLRKALGNGEFSLHYQPQVTLEGARLVGAEALLRWRNAELGNITPDRFIGIAEDTGLINEIGAWVLEEACRTATAWNRGSAEVKVAVNLSTRQFRNRHLVSIVRNALAAAECRPQWIELEITESLLLEENSEVKEIMEALRAMGLTFAIDDFGTGYSALGYLRRFPIDTIKIDRSFVNGIAEDGHARALVRAILSMAEVLELSLVAEGVETEQQRDLLHEWGGGAHLAQGWLFGRPMPREEFEQKLLGGTDDQRARGR